MPEQLHLGSGNIDRTFPLLVHSIYKTCGGSLWNRAAMSSFNHILLKVLSLAKCTSDTAHILLQSANCVQYTLEALIFTPFSWRCLQTINCKQHNTLDTILYTLYCIPCTVYLGHIFAKPVCWGGQPSEPENDDTPQEGEDTSIVWLWLDPSWKSIHRTSPTKTSQYSDTAWMTLYLLLHN